MEFDTGDVLHQGWLTKSPPLETKKQLFNQSLITPKWRRRWFVLRQGGMPGQFLLQYYTDASAKKHKGTIDLDQCEQVDTGLSYQSGKVHYQHMFDIKTPRRVFYLAADSEQEMTAWVEWICQICGLRTYLTEDQESAPPSSNNFVSGPYLHLSDCFTGTNRPPHTRPTRVTPPVAPLPSVTTAVSTLSSVSTSGARLPSGRKSPQYLNNPPTDQVDSSVTCDDSVFLPNYSPAPTMRSLTSRSTLSSSEPPSTRLSNSEPAPSSPLPPYQPPGRPPKPQNLRSVSCSDPPPSTPPAVSLVVPEVPGAVPPPLIDRTLKPERKSITSMDLPGKSITSIDLPGTCPLSSLPPPPAPPGLPPPVERGRKPPGGDGGPQGMWIPGDCGPEDEDEELMGLCRESIGDNRNYVEDEDEEEQIFFYMPSLQQSVGGRWDPLMIPATEVLEQQVQYLDLDLPGSDRPSERSKLDVQSPATVYKTVDFVKTEAFNRTRQKVEEYKYNIKPDK